MTRIERYKLASLWLLLTCVPIFMRNLWEPDEARYAEIAREMLVLKDWLTPHLNFVPYFEKPPLQYWLSAVSMKIFGFQPYAARLPLILAGIISLWCAWRLAKLLKARNPIVASAMVATSILAYIVGQLLTLDALFAAFQSLALVSVIEAVTRHFYGINNQKWGALAFISLALATLTKGLAAPILFSATVIGSLFWAAHLTKLRDAILATFINPLNWLMFTLLTAPWFIAVNIVNPGHSKFFFIHEHFARFTSYVHSRQGFKNPFFDKLYFFLILALGLMPWLSISLQGIWRSIKSLICQKTIKTDDDIVYDWIVVTVLLSCFCPLVFYSWSCSKLPPYILPAVVPILALACKFACLEDGLIDVRYSGWELVILSTIMVSAYVAYSRATVDLRLVVFVSAVFLTVGIISIYLSSPVNVLWVSSLGFILLLMSLAASIAVGRTRDVSKLLKQAPANAQWISCGKYFQTIPFISGCRSVVIGQPGELEFGCNKLSLSEQAYWFPKNEKDLTQVALQMYEKNNQLPVWALITKDAWQNLPYEQRLAWSIHGQASSCLIISLC